MANRSTARKTSWAEPSLFGDDQGDLFGVSAPEPYKPRPEHVRNSLIRLVGEMERAETWPWRPSEIKRRRDHWLEHLCSLLDDEAEADDWRRRIATASARLDAASETASEE